MTPRSALYLSASYVAFARGSLARLGRETKTPYPPHMPLCKSKEVPREASQRVSAFPASCPAGKEKRGLLAFAKRHEGNSSQGLRFYSSPLARKENGGLFCLPACFLSFARRRAEQQPKAPLFSFLAVRLGREALGHLYWRLRKEDLGQ